MARTDAIVLGAGIVGTSASLHLAKRGLSVALVDRRPPGEETSYGNAGVIEGNTLFPHAFPSGFGALIRIALKQAPDDGPHAMLRLLARVIGVGIETADMLVQEVLARNMRDRRAIARYAGLTGSPDESGSKRREKGLAKAGNARVRRGMMQLAWRFLLFQKESALAQWYRARTADARGGTRKTLIVALARKLLITYWTMWQTSVCLGRR